MRLLTAFVGAFLLSGCAYTYIDGEGNLHSLGLIHQTVLMKKEVPGASAVQVTNVGLSVIRSNATSSISLGFNSEEFTFVENNACIGPGCRRYAIPSLTPAKEGQK